MPSGSCFVPECRSGYRSDRKQRKLEGKKNLSLFRVPRDADLLKKWQIAIQRADKELSYKDLVCESHFKENEIERHYVTKLPNGVIHIIERGWPILKPDAVPSIFPYLPNYLPKEVTKRKPPAECNPVFSNSRKLKYTDTVQVPDLYEDGEQITHFSFSVLLNNLFKVKKPNKCWCISQHEHFIICVKWNKNFVAEKKIVFDENLKFKVFLFDNEVIGLDWPLDITCLEDVSKALQTVEDYIIFPKTGNVCSC